MAGFRDRALARLGDPAMLAQALVPAAPALARRVLGRAAEIAAVRVTALRAGALGADLLAAVELDVRPDPAERFHALDLEAFMAAAEPRIPSPRFGTAEPYTLRLELAVLVRPDPAALLGDLLDGRPGHPCALVVYPAGRPGDVAGRLSAAGLTPLPL
ncbi:hypothetical protein [Nonomuraea sp. NPDC050310]|uniref:hypothetical protein n=1 Tax=unclassified Nonomuraea TaxID=2593643 RepID=UPI0034082237